VCTIPEDALWSRTKDREELEMMPIGPLMIEHRWIERVIADLQLRLGAHSPRKPIDPAYVERVVDFLRTYADRCHHGKEEDQLFPAMRAKGAGGPLALFLEEHEEGRRYLRTLSSSAPSAERAAAARRYVGMLQDHIERENEVLFPMADELFTAEEHGALARAYEDVELRVVGAGVHEGLLATLARLEAAVPCAPVAP
jgi:hemerythrin-like domain-containing protein